MGELEEEHRHGGAAGVRTKTCSIPQGSSCDPQSRTDASE